MFQELGHSLGLSHSDVKTALMAPFYRGYEANIRLDKDDIEGIRALYGEKEEVKVKSVNNISDTDNTPQTRVDNKVKAPVETKDLQLRPEEVWSGSVYPSELLQDCSENSKELERDVLKHEKKFNSLTKYQYFRTCVVETKWIQ